MTLLAFEEGGYQGTFFTPGSRLVNQAGFAFGA